MYSAKRIELLYASSSVEHPGTQTRIPSFGPFPSKIAGKTSAFGRSEASGLWVSRSLLIPMRRSIQRLLALSL
jgi:hypothetical protein